MNEARSGAFCFVTMMVLMKMMMFKGVCPVLAFCFLFFFSLSLLVSRVVGVVDSDKIQDIAPLNQIKVLSYKDKGDWILETKYNIGAKKKKTED